MDGDEASPHIGAANALMGKASSVDPGPVNGGFRAHSEGSDRIEGGRVPF